MSAGRWDDIDFTTSALFRRFQGSVNFIWIASV
jgi:hypothetical protein